jgi:hypothetical protein
MTVDERLHAAADDVRAFAATVEPERLVSPAAVRQLRPARRPWLALAAAAIILLVIGVLAILQPAADEPSMVDEPMPTLPAPAVPEPTAPDRTAAPETTEPGADVPAGPAPTWTRVDDPDLGGQGYQVINSIRSVRSGLMAVGRDNDRPALWYSDDGLEWTRIEDTSGAFGAEYSAYADESTTWLTDIADNGSRMVAVGIDILDRAGVSSDLNPKVKAMAVWYSDDGHAWTRVPHNDDVFGMTGGEGPAERVVATDTGFVAVGQEYPPSASSASIWTSPDGETWTRAEAPGAVSDAVTTENGVLLVGVSGPDDGMFREAAWYSADGIAWSAADIETDPTGDRYSSSFGGVTQTAEGYLALVVLSMEVVEPMKG